MKKPRKQIKDVFEKVMERNGKGMGKAMVESGYSKSTAKNPQQITESKSWQMLLEQELPESLIVGTHKEAFNATKIITSLTEPDRIEPDWQIKMKAVELGYKVRGKLVDSQTNVQVNNIKPTFKVFSNEAKKLLEQLYEGHTSTNN